MKKPSPSSANICSLSPFFFFSSCCSLLASFFFYATSASFFFGVGDAVSPADSSDSSSSSSSLAYSYESSPPLLSASGFFTVEVLLTFFVDGLFFGVSFLQARVALGEPSGYSDSFFFGLFSCVALAWFDPPIAFSGAIFLTCCVG